MNSVTVFLLPSGSKQFTSAENLAVTMEQFWLVVKDQDGRIVAGVPREQVSYFTTSFNA